MNRVVIIGLDGVPFGLLKDFSESGVMPNTAKIISGGTFKKMQSSIPEISSVAWSSIITGKNPAEHGIFGFTDFPRNTYRLSFPNFSHLKASTFWELNPDKRHIVVNVPSTYPAREINGILISGFVALDLERAVYPEAMIAHLENMDYRIDVDSAKAHKSLELFIKDLNRTNEARISAYRHLWDKDWDTFMLVFTGSDRLMHFLWDAYEDTNHEFSQEFRDYFRRVDEIIGEIAFRINAQDDLIMLSDHGFEKLDKDVYINRVLQDEGFLKLMNVDSPNFSHIDYETKAFALDPARIYINLKGKYPRGTVGQDEKEDVIRDLVYLFDNFQIDGKRAILRIYRKEEIYKGPYVEQAPDLVLVGTKGFNLKAAINSKTTYSKGIFSGKHTQDDAFLLINKKCEGIIKEGLNVSDVVDIIKKLKEESIYERQIT